jgi:cell division septum initiation protein DivIVA
MALDRQSIERRDFPIGRRGYEPEVVDEHLQRLADEIETLQRSAHRRSGASLAQAASEQVRAIVAAAEQSAAAIERDAEAEAAQIRQDASRDAERTDQEAVERSREHVAKVSEQSSLMLQRVDAMEQELSSLVDSLRTGGNRLKADLSLLETNMEDLYTASGGGRAEKPSRQAPLSPPPAAVSAPPVPTPADEAFEEDEVGDEELPAAVAPPAPATPPEAAPQPERTQRPADGDTGDIEGARLIALNMALNGQSRDETDRYLAENFDLVDRQALLDEVYESVGG